MDGTAVTVESVSTVGPDTVAITIETPPDFDALPGQFVTLRATPDGASEPVTRYYTLSSPTVTDTFEITVGVDPDGELAPWLADLDGGETVLIDGPFGTLSYEGDRDVVTIAGGPGVGPAVAIAEAARIHDKDATVIYQDDEPAHEERLSALEADGTSVTIVGADDRKGLADAIGSHIDDGQFYVFGFASFVQTVADCIDDAGGDADEALIESFG